MLKPYRDNFGKDGIGIIINGIEVRFYSRPELLIHNKVEQSSDFNDSEIPGFERTEHYHVAQFYNYLIFLEQLATYRDKNILEMERELEFETLFKWSEEFTWRYYHQFKNDPTKIKLAEKQHDSTLTFH